MHEPLSSACLFSSSPAFASAFVTMSRALPSPPLSSLTLSQIQTLANDSEGITDRSPRDWFERARHEADLAVLAERKGEKEEMFLAYTRACAAYANAKMHPDFAGAKRADAHWANRVKDFKEVSGAHRLGVLTVMIRRECIVLIESDI
jgi:hypothetical protein